MPELLITIGIFLAPTVATILIGISWYRSDKSKREKEKVEKEKQSVGISVAAAGTDPPNLFLIRCRQDFGII
jgi:hypothetical protein